MPGKREIIFKSTVSLGILINLVKLQLLKWSIFSYEIFANLGIISPKLVKAVIETEHRRLGKKIV